jgi:hypothetical protein
MYVRFPLSLRTVENLLFERGIDICHDHKADHVRRRIAITERVGGRLHPTDLQAPCPARNFSLTVPRKNCYAW